MQVQMKLALLRQQKAEQLAYGHSMQAERLDRLTNQREEYERTLASQREVERSQLIAQEQHVYRQQFGGDHAPIPDPYATPIPSVGYAPTPGPLPPKMDPPPYQPLPSLYQPALYQPEAIDSHTHHVMPSGPLVEAPPQHYASPHNFATPTPVSVNVPSSFTGVPPQQNHTHHVPLMTGVATPTLLQRPPSEPPLISFD